jgi:dipeptidyl-peptidase-4
MWKAILPLIPVVTLAAQDAGRLTVESLYHPTRRVTYLEPLGSTFLWRPDGTLLEERSAKGAFTGVYRVQRGSFDAVPLLDRAQVTAALTAAGASEIAGATPLAWNPARDAFAAKCGPDLYLVELATAKARKLGTGEAPAFSPDGTWVAYLEGSDIRAVELATGKEAKVTTGGDATHLNGRLDWVYQEEVFGERGNARAFWWSPDSRRIAYLSLDDSRVPVVTLMDDRTQPQVAVATAYPKAGDPLPQARLGLADLEGQTTWMEDPYPGQDTLVTRVGFDPKGRLVAQFSDRIQSFNDCRIFEGTASRVLVQERSRTWVDHAPLPLFLKDGRFLWQSARTGFSHIYLCDAQGRQTPITQGPWDVRRILGVDEAGGKVFFEATQRSAVGLDAYRADLEGQGLRRLTEAPGTHALTFNASFTAAVDRWSDVDNPPQDVFLDGEGVVLHHAPALLTPALQAVRKGKVLFQQVKTRDGFPMETMLVLPPDFNPSRKYPVFHYVYGGPNAPLVKNAWNRNGLWFQFLAQQGIVTWICDNRSASAKGASAHGIHRNLGALELRDQLDGLEWLRAQGWADMDRIALHGYSYGGYLTAFALTHSKAWKLGIIGAPVTDWRLYDAVYTERYMGLPQDNAAGYDASSALKAASKLGGKVMLIHGTLDTNVHPQNSVQFLDALQKAGFNAPLILMPGSDHSPRAPQHQWAMYEGIWAFLKANL